MNPDRDPAVVGDRLESQIAVRLIGEADLGFHVSREEAEALEARAILIEEERAGELPLNRDALEEGAEIGPIGQQERRDIDQDLVVVAHGGDGERLRDRVTEGVGNGPSHRCPWCRDKVGVHHPQLDPVAGPVESNQIGSHRGASIEAELADSLRQLGDEEVVAVELPRRQRQVGVVPFPIDGKDAALDLGALGHLGEGLPGTILPVGFLLNRGISSRSDDRRRISRRRARGTRRVRLLRVGADGAAPGEKHAEEPSS